MGFIKNIAHFDSVFFLNIIYSVPPWSTFMTRKQDWPILFHSVLEIWKASLAQHLPQSAWGLRAGISDLDHAGATLLQVTTPPPFLSSH